MRLPTPVHVVVPGSLNTATGGFAYDRHVVAALRDAGRLGWVVELPDRFPFPPPSTVAAAFERLAAVPDDGMLVIDGLCLTPLLDAIKAQSARRPLLAVVHHPLADETGLGADQRAGLLAAEITALALVRGVVVTSDATADRLRELGVGPERIRVVRPGVDKRATARPARPPTRPGRPPRILCVASLTPRKGHEMLLRALRRIADLPWELLLVGPERDRGCGRRIRRLAQDFGLAGRVRVTGAVPDPVLRALYAKADVFALATFHEGYGMALAEAAAAGLPIVACRAGAVREAVPPSARLVPPGDVAALARALTEALHGRPPPLRAEAPFRHRPRPWSAMHAEIIGALAALARA